jgi:hypothetical protein
MNRWQRLAAAFPLVMALIDQADTLRKFTGNKKSVEYDTMIADIVDGVVAAVEIAVGRDLIDNAKLRTAVMASLDVPPFTAAKPS